MALKTLRITQTKRGVSRIMTKRLEAEDNPKRVLKPEEDQGYASVLLAVGPTAAAVKSLRTCRKS